MSPDPGDTLSIICRDLYKRYPNARSVARMWAIAAITLEARAGDVVGLVGPNGAGKTTLIKCLAGLLLPTAGTILVLGLDPIRKRHRLIRRVGILLDSGRQVFGPLSVEQNLLYFARLRGLSARDARHRAQELLAAFDLERLARTAATKLSVGQRQRMLLAGMLMTDPEVLLLDEPARGLDQEAKIALAARLRNETGQGRTVLVSSHELDWLETVATKIGLLFRGRVIAFDRLEALKARIGVPRFIWELSERPRPQDRVALQALGIEVMDEVGSTTTRSHRSPDAVVTLILPAVNPSEVGHVFRILEDGRYTVKRFRQEGGDLEAVYTQVLKSEQEQQEG